MEWNEGAQGRPVGRERIPRTIVFRTWLEQTCMFLRYSVSAVTLSAWLGENKY